MKESPINKIINSNIIYIEPKIFLKLLKKHLNSIQLNFVSKLTLSNFWVVWKSINREYMYVNENSKKPK